MKKKRTWIFLIAACAMFFLFLGLRHNGDEELFLTEFKVMDQENLKQQAVKRYNEEIEDVEGENDLKFQRNIFSNRAGAVTGLPGLKGIVIGRKRLAFFSNGEEVVEGEKISGYTVEEIHENQLVLIDSEKKKLILKLWRD